MAWPLRHARGAMAAFRMAFDTVPDNVDKSA
jgi:hypothetical protein